MFTKGYTEIRALIETQYGVLSQMIYDIDNHYQTSLQHINNDIQQIAKENANGDYDVYTSIVHDFDDELDRQKALCIEARRTLFCSIFSYYEKMLYGIADYYQILSKATQVKQLYNAILAEYKNRYADTINIAPEQVNNTNETYRLLRNYFIHGKLSNKCDRDTLYFNIDFVDGIEHCGYLCIEITQSAFLYTALDNIKFVLTSIEDAFSNKAQDEWKAYNEARKYFFEAIKLYPPESPGAEDEYPPYCPIAVYRYLENAEQICLHLVSPQRKGVKTLLSSIRQFKKYIKILGLCYPSYRNIVDKK